MVEKNETGNDKDILKTGQEYDLELYVVGEINDSQNKSWHLEPLKKFEGLRLQENTQIGKDRVVGDNGKGKYTLISREIRSIEQGYSDCRQKALSSDLSSKYTSEMLDADLEDIDSYYLEAISDAFDELDRAFLERELRDIVSRKELEALQNLDTILVIAV